MLYNPVFRIMPPFYIPLGGLIPSSGVLFLRTVAQHDQNTTRVGICSLLEPSWCKMLCFVIYSLPYLFIYYSCTIVLLQKNTSFRPRVKSAEVTTKQFAQTIHQTAKFFNFRLLIYRLVT
jgi:hypothetical protein